MSLEKLIEMSRMKLTPEQIAEMNERRAELDRKWHEEWVKRHRCSECGTDTWNYSHTFRCSLRGSGF